MSLRALLLYSLLSLVFLMCTLPLVILLSWAIFEKTQSLIVSLELDNTFRFSFLFQNYDHHFRRRTENIIHLQEFLKFLTLIFIDNEENFGWENTREGYWCGPPAQRLQVCWVSQALPCILDAFEEKTIIMKMVSTYWRPNKCQAQILSTFIH